MLNNRLRIPQGTEAFYLGEAYAHRELVRKFENTCSSWGFLPVETPVFDFQELYRGLDNEMARSSYRLVDRDGDVLVLRSDITLFLARQIGMFVEKQDLPVRVYYGDTILRHEDPNDLSKNEFFQIGAELIGNGGVEADAEMVLLLLEAADALGTQEAVLHLGSRALVRQTDGSEAFARAIQDRDWGTAVELLVAEGAAPTRVEAVGRLYRFIGTADELRVLVASLDGLVDGEIAAIDHLLELSDVLAAVGRTDRVRLDLSEVGDREYYSGIVFHLYDEGADAPLASGGRYDELLERFGSKAPSVGFSIMLRRLQSRLHSEALPKMPEVEPAGEGGFRERFERARELRAQGRVVSL